MKFSNMQVSSLKSFIVPALILVTIVLMIPFAFIPLLNNVKSTNDQLRQESERLAKLSEKLAVLDSLDEQEISEKLALAEEALPVGKSLAQLVVGVQNLAARSSLLVDGVSLSPGKVATESAVEKVSDKTQTEKSSQSKVEPKSDTLIVQLSLRGTVSQVEKFLSGLQRAKRLSFAEDVDLKSSERKSFLVEITLSIPFRPIPKLTGDVLAQPVPLLGEENKKTLELIDQFVNITNIKINEVGTGKVKDPFKGD